MFVLADDIYNRQNQMSPFCKTKRLKKSAHIHTEADTKTMPASAILQAFKHHLNGI